ncbi:permease prefix domain 1-containing protein [Verrucomicrobiales bacterium]|nr:permease prefix domain 1-containing protein [Verrucomicrobiales bacterium]
MFDLDKALASWRETYARNDSIDLDSLTELENHLRDEIDALMDQGLSSQEAYEEACAQLGQESTLNAEYAKVHPDVSWKRRMLAMLVGYMSVGVLLSAAGMITSLFEGVLWHFGLDKVVCSLPWSVYVENSAFRATSTEASADIIRWDEVSLATLLTAGVRAVALGMIVYLIYRCLHGRFSRRPPLLALHQWRSLGHHRAA